MEICVQDYVIQIDFVDRLGLAYEIFEVFRNKKIKLSWINLWHQDDTEDEMKKTEGTKDKSAISSQAFVSEEEKYKDSMRADFFADNINKVKEAHQEVMMVKPEDSWR